MNRFLYAHVILPGEAQSERQDMGGPFVAVHDPSTGVRATMGVIQVGFDDSQVLHPLVLIAVNDNFVNFFCEAAYLKVGGQYDPRSVPSKWGQAAHSVLTRASTGLAQPLNYQITRCDLHRIMNGNAALYAQVTRTLKARQTDLPFGRVTYLGLSGSGDLVRKPDGSLCDLDDMSLFACLASPCSRRDSACPESPHPKCPHGFTLDMALPIRGSGLDKGFTDTGFSDADTDADTDADADTADTASAWPWVIASAIASVGAVAVVGYALSGRSARRY